MDVLVGLQYGDEGKGKITDLLSEKYDMVARYQGGNNAGHTLYHNGKKLVLNHIPSGIIHENIKNVLGNGMVINPHHLMNEIENVKSILIGSEDRIFLSENAHIITPVHLLQDFIQGGKVGTTMKGIGPCYRDKIYRKGIRVKDLFDNFDEKLSDISSELNSILSESKLDLEEQREFLNHMREFKISTDYIRDNMNIIKSDFVRKFDGNVLAEGAQGTMLDIDHGSYPFVTSSTTLSSGSLTGLAMPPRSIDKVYGVFKSYLTRVGNGDMETELNDNVGKYIQGKGNEFGATTGRPRRCGWLNMDELKESVELNGITDLIMTKTDILSGIKTIKILFENEYHEFNGWESTNVDDSKNFKDISLKKYVDFIESKVGVRIKYVSISPERNGIIIR